MNKAPRVAGWIEDWTRAKWEDHKLFTWIIHYEPNGDSEQVQFDRVVIVPFDEAVKLGIVKQDKQQEPSHD